jgi:hypothetical protein
MGGCKSSRFVSLREPATLRSGVIERLKSILLACSVDITDFGIIIFSAFFAARAYRAGRGGFVRLLAEPRHLRIYQGRYNYLTI